MRKHFFLLCFVLSFASCSNKKEVPRNVVPVDQFHKVLWDVMQADELVNYQYTSDSSLNNYVRSVELYKQILQLHNVSVADFKRSIGYYQKRPDLLKIIFDSLQKKADTLNSSPAWVPYTK
ncbi:MAG: DUF4296 domain-containing protein [Chitinophagaceae bacterium]